MFCPSCGKSEQVADSYCRNCGAFLSDFSGKSYLLNKLLGGQKPETQVTVTLVINLVTALISSLLLGFLNGYYDALYNRTHESPPSVIYPVYVFLGLVALWQILSFLIGLRVRKKFKGRRETDQSTNPSPDLPGAKQNSLPESHFESARASCTEDETRILDRLPRQDVRR